MFEVKPDTTDVEQLAPYAFYRRLTPLPPPSEFSVRGTMVDHWQPHSEGNTHQKDFRAVQGYTTPT